MKNDIHVLINVLINTGCLFFQVVQRAFDAVFEWLLEMPTYIRMSPLPLLLPILAPHFRTHILGGRTQ